MKKRIIALFLVLTVCVGLFTGCGQKKPTDVCIIIDTAEITREEVLFYIAEYEVYGITVGSETYSNIEDFWNVKNDDGISNREYYYTMAYADISYNAIFSILAKKNGVELTAAEIETADKYAEEYFSLYTENEVKKSGMTLNGFKLAVERQALVGKYQTILQEGFEIDRASIEAKYNKADYAAVKTEYISVSTEGLSEDQLKTVNYNLNLAAEKLAAGMSCEDIIKELDQNVNYKKGLEYLWKNQTAEDAYATAASALEKDGDVSSIVNGEKTAYVIRLAEKDCSEYYDYTIENAIQEIIDEEMAKYYQQIAYTYTRTIKDKVVELEQFGSYCNSEYK